jgi:hypothetical protein
LEFFRGREPQIKVAFSRIILITSGCGQIMGKQKVTTENTLDIAHLTIRNGVSEAAETESF